MEKIPNFLSLLPLLEQDEKFPTLPKGIKDLRIRLNTSRAYLKYKEPGYRGKKHYGMVHSVLTEGCGTIEKEEWMKRFQEELSSASSEVKILFDQIMRHAKENCLWLKTEEELFEYAATCLCSEAYKSWKERKSW